MVVVEAGEKCAGGPVVLRGDCGGPSEVGDRLVGGQGRALEHGGEEGRRPLAWPHLRHAARIGDRHKSREIVALAAEGIAHPRSHAGEAVEREARGHLIFPRPVRVALGRHRVDEAHLISERPQVRQQIARHRAALSAGAKFPLRADEIAVLPLKCDQFLPPVGHRRIVPADQLRLVVEGVDVGERPGAEDDQHPRRPRGEVRRAGVAGAGRIDQRPKWYGGWRGGTEQVVPAEERCQGHAAKPGGTAGEKITPIEQLATGE